MTVSRLTTRASPEKNFARGGMQSLAAVRQQVFDKLDVFLDLLLEFGEARLKLPEAAGKLRQGQCDLHVML